MDQSAGTLLYRHTDSGLEVLLVHPSGNYNRHAAWSIPKGYPEPDESLEEAARRETREETGIEPDRLFALSYVEYRSRRKRVYGFAGPAPESAQPLCASWEVDRAEFVPIDRARQLLHRDQVPFLERLVTHLNDSLHGEST